MKKPIRINNKRQAMIELKRLQKENVTLLNNLKELKEGYANLIKINKEQGINIDNVLSINKEQQKLNKELIEKNIQLMGIIEEQEGQLKEQEGEIKELKQENAELKQHMNKQDEKLDDEIVKIKQHGIDLVALAKGINSLNDKKIVFEDEYADWEDKYNQLAKFAEENPRLKEGINLEVMKRGMQNAIKSTKFIDEKLDEVYKLVNEIINFEEFNYRNI